MVKTVIKLGTYCGARVHHDSLVTATHGASVHKLIETEKQSTIEPQGLWSYNNEDVLLHWGSHTGLLQWDGHTGLLQWDSHTGLLQWDSHTGFRNSTHNCTCHMDVV